MPPAGVPRRDIVRGASQLEGTGTHRALVVIALLVFLRHGGEFALLRLVELAPLPGGGEGEADGRYGVVAWRRECEWVAMEVRRPARALETGAARHQTVAPADAPAQPV